MRRLWRRAIAVLGGCLAIILVAVPTLWWLANPAVPDAFYVALDPAPEDPGRLLRQEPFERNLPAGARAWRILYTTTRANDAPALGSAIVMVARRAGATARPVIAWTHGTTGVVPGCAPSLLAEPFANVPALAALIERDWIYVAADYVGQGTAGPHPYLIGEDEGRSALDAVRAARQIEGLNAGAATVVWGHSQGGNAALWTAIVAPSYAPDVPVAGVAAIAPATDLPALVEELQHTLTGRIMSAYLLQSYSQTYVDVDFDAYARGWSGLMARDMSRRCFAGRAALFSALEAASVRGTIFATPPTSGALGARLVENTPDRTVSQPLLIAQGVIDDLVLPAIQARFVAQRCQEGQALEYRRYAGRHHLSVVAPDSPLNEDLVNWTQDRLSGVSPPLGCTDELVPEVGTLDRVRSGS